MQQCVEHALNIGLPEQYPAAWAVLAVDAKDQLDAIREAHAETPDTGPGWYLAARPAPPQVPVGLESRLGAAALVEDPAQMVADLIALREAAADLEVDDQLGEVYTEAIALLSLQLNRQANDQRRGRAPSSVTVTELDAVLDQTPVSFSAPWAGPVIDEWKAILTPVEDATVALRQRRVVDLLGGDESVDPSSVDAVYRDRDGRYVVVRPARGYHRHGNAFAYGYDGGTPATTYTAILRCALPVEHQRVDLGQYRMWSDDGERPTSQLWDAIATTKGPLRLPWSQVQQWARTDLATTKAAARPERAIR